MPPVSPPTSACPARAHRAAGNARVWSASDQPRLRPSVGELLGFEIFRGLPTAELEGLRAAMRVVARPAGVEVIAPDDPDPSTVFFILVGRVQVVRTNVDGRSVRLGELGAGELFGDLAAIDGRERSAGVETIKPCRLGVMAREAFLEAITTSPALSLAMMRVLALRARRQNARLFENVCLDLREQIVAELLRRLELEDGVGVIREAPRQIDLANTLGARRESVAREFGRLIREGLLRRQQGQLVIPDPDALRRLARSDDADGSSPRETR